MHTFNSEETAIFFNKTFAPQERDQTSTPETKLRHRDHILLRYILEPLKKRKLRILDFGCGQGRQLAHLIANGYDVVGMEKHPGMREHAERELAQIDSTGRLIAGGIPELAVIKPGSFDIIVMLGVMQYLSEEEYETAIEACANILKPGGLFVATFQNSFFDLFTFNKYTLDFFMNALVGPFLENSERAKVEQALAGLMTNPDKPPHHDGRARDNVFVRLTNPITIGDDMLKRGFTLRAKYFYEWFGLPPLLGSQHATISQRITQRFEVENPTAWQGYFMANAFLAEFEHSGLRTSMSFA